VVVLPCGVPVLGIQFPFHARSFKTTVRIKYIHIAMVIVGLVLPTLPVIVTFTAGNSSSRGFGQMRFPPILYTSLQRDPTFYSLVLPINILIATGPFTRYTQEYRLLMTILISAMLYLHR